MNTRGNGGTDNDSDSEENDDDLVEHDNAWRVPPEGTSLQVEIDFKNQMKAMKILLHRTGTSLDNC